MNYVPPHLVGKKEKPPVHSPQKPPTKQQAVTENGVTLKTNSPYTPLETLTDLPGAGHLSFVTPTPVQRHAIPVLSHGHGIMVRAPTGMGKTLCFLLPLLADVSPRGIPRVLVVTPTRELAEQIHTVAEAISAGRGLAVSLVVGGGAGSARSRRTGDVIVATPGRLLDFFNRGRIDGSTILSLVLDEADKLLEMGFERDIRAIRGFVPDNSRVCLFSATYHKMLDKIIAEFLPEKRYSVEVANETVSTIKQTILNVENKDKSLFEILSKLTLKSSWKRGGGDKVMIFVERKVTAKLLESKLLEQGILCSSLHGDKEQSDRSAILARFRGGLLPVLVATSVAARGIDVKDIRLVINYDFPRDIKEYIHRIGRTGREGKPGEAMSFVDSTASFGLLGELIEVLKESRNEVPPFLLKKGSMRSCSLADSTGFHSRPRAPPRETTAHRRDVLSTSLSSMSLYKNTTTEKSDSEDDLPGEW